MNVEPDEFIIEDDVSSGNGEKHRRYVEVRLSWVKFAVLLLAFVIPVVALWLQMSSTSGKLDDANANASSINDTQNCIVGMFFILPEDRQFMEPADVSELCPGIEAEQVVELRDLGGALRLQSESLSGPAYEQFATDEGRYRVRSVVESVDGPAVEVGGELIMDTDRIYRNPECSGEEVCQIRVDFITFFAPIDSDDSDDVDESVGRIDGSSVVDANMREQSIVRYTIPDLDPNREWTFHSVLRLHDHESEESLGSFAVLSEPFQVIP